MCESRNGEQLELQIQAYGANQTGIKVQLKSTYVTLFLLITILQNLFYYFKFDDVSRPSNILFKI
jgi:hypothetical protein